LGSAVRLVIDGCLTEMSFEPIISFPCLHQLIVLIVSSTGSPVLPIG